MSAMSDDLAVLDQLAEDFVGRLRRGERPSIQSYAEQRPKLASEIQRLFPTLVTMEGIRSAGQSAPMERVAAPTRIGDYRIVRPLGEGGMGIVYEAIQESLGRHVALKILPKSTHQSERHRERFRVEARAAARLHHPHIVPVFGVGEADGIMYYAMQYIAGR
jgi:serine/threonine protein kinase